MRRVAVALLHHPVLDRDGGVLTTTLTTIDVHDIARSARTYGLDALYVVHPYASQRTLAERILGHWIDGGGKRRIPDRAEALGIVQVVADLDAMARGVAGAGEGSHDVPPGSSFELWTTAANARGGELTSYDEARELLGRPGKPVVIAFGTGWGLAPELLARADRRLEPIVGRDSGYNHLSVRAACAITLDRLFRP